MRTTIPPLLRLLFIALWPFAQAHAFDWDAARQNLGTVEVTETKLTPVGAENEKGPWIKIPSVLAQSNTSTYTPKNGAHNEVEYSVTKGGWIFFAAFFGAEGDRGEWKKERKDEKQLQADGWTLISSDESGGPFIGRMSHEYKIFAKQLAEGTTDKFHVNKYSAPQFLSFGAIPPAAIAGLPKSAPAAPAPSSATAKTPAPLPAEPKAAPKGLESIAVADTIEAKGGAVNLAPGVIPFDAPRGDGRHGAKGLLLKSNPPAPGGGSTWTFGYLRSGSARGLQIIHPLGEGQIIIQISPTNVGLFTSSVWAEIGYGPGNVKALTHAESFGQAFPLKDDTEYQVVSRLSSDGAYELLLDGKLVVTGFIGSSSPLSLEIPAGIKNSSLGHPPLAFSGADLPLQWSAGWASLICGPMDKGANRCRAVRYYPNYVDPVNGILASIPRQPASQTSPPVTANSNPVATPAPQPAPNSNPPVIASLTPPATLPPQPPPGSLSAADVVKANRSNLVFVTTADGAGSGFIAHYGTGTFLITNAHVAAGAKGAMFKTLDGTQLQAGSPAAAVGHDIFLMALPHQGAPLEIMVGVDQDASIGDAVVVLGNAEGAGVINTIQGKIVGIGPNLVEVDAPFQPGNSGSPIIHLKTGKVIGVATYLTIRKYDNATKQPVKEPIVRRFGYRLDSIKAWQSVNWQAFYSQATEMESIEKLTDDLVAFIEDMSKDGRVARGAHTNPAIKNRINQWLEARAKRLSPHDAAMADQSLISFLKITCQSDITAAQQHLTYDYFQRGLADQQRERKEIADVFSNIIDDLRK